MELRERLEMLIPEGSTLWTTRIDYGRRNVEQRYYAIFVMHQGDLTNVSGFVAKFLNRKWANNNGPNWSNASGVLARSENDLIEELANELYCAYTAKEIGRTFVHHKV